MSTLWQDLRYAVRMLAKSPGFTAAVVLSLALGIGANTAIFSLIDAVMLRFLPVTNPEKLVLMSWGWRGQGEPPMIHNLSGEARSFSYPTFRDLRASSDILSDVFAFADTGMLNFNADGHAGLAEGELASGRYFSGLGVRAAVGRLFTDIDDKPDSVPTAVISYGYWERRFGRDPSAVGKAVIINRVPFTIVGVSSPEFFGVQPGRSIAVWLPLSTQPLVEPRWSGEEGRSIFERRDDWWVTVMGRLQSGVSEQRALGQLGVVFRHSASDPADSITKSRGQKQLRADSSQSDLLALNFIPGSKGLQTLRNEFSKPLFILMAVVGFVLLIACANVANLFLARAASRHKEMAVRLAVGAARRRLIRQLLTESVLLSTIGGMLGLLLAYWATRLLVSLMSSGPEVIALTVRPDLRVLVFTAAVSLFTGVLFGLAPALRGTRLNLTTALKENSKESSTKRQSRIELGSMLVATQVAMSLLLLTGAALFVHTLVNLECIDVGFDKGNLLIFGIDPTQNGYKGEKVVGFYQELQRRIEALPGVKSATLSRHSLIGDGERTNGISIQGYTPLHGVPVEQVGPRFFETMNVPLVLGRSIEERDTVNAPNVAVINETLARKCFGGSSPIGRRFGIGDVKPTADIEIVGVAADTKISDLRTAAPPTIFLAAFQDLDLGFIRFEVRTAGDPRDMISAVRHAVQSLDKDLPISDVKTQVEQIDQTLFQERLFAKLSSLFGLLALILACIGLYGTMSYSVVRRTNEIGIRMALGARQEVILRTMMWQALMLVFAGVGIGIPLAWGVLRLISNLLFGIKPTDPLTLAGSVALMLIVAAIAGYIPARRAAKVDPMVALRYE